MSARVAVITGGASGIGRETCLKFAREGDQVVVADINEAKGLETIDLIKSEGGDAAFVKTDVSKFEEIDALVNQTVDIYGSIDVMFNNAAIGTLGHVLSLNIEDYLRVIGVNQHGVAYGIIAAGRKMRDLNVEGVIINTSSVFAYLANFGTFPYLASKGAVRMMTQTAALELAQNGIRVVGIAPGGVDTPIIQGYKDAGMTQKLTEQQMRKELIRPEKIADAVYLLSLKEADVINGSIVMLDDGYASFK